MKKILSLLLCFTMILVSLVSCGSKEEETDEGAQIKVYISEPIYNFDPAEAYKNDSALKIVSLLFDNLFVMNEKGKVEGSLAKSYKINKSENSMIIELREDSYWSDGSLVTADDIAFAWQRILDPANSFEAAALLYDIKNAKAAKDGLVTIDDVGISALNKSEFEIVFEDRAIDYDAFLNKLTSYALAPLKESAVTAKVNVANDWAKSPTLMVSNGPFRLKSVSYVPETAGITLERNKYYRRDTKIDAIDKAVTPFRLIIDYTKTGEDIVTAFEAGEIFFIGDLPLSARSKYTLEEWQKKANVSDALSTHTYFLNENAEINGTKLFADKNVREALSLVINRDEIAKTIVFAEAATGLVPNGVFNENTKGKTFRDASETSIVTTPNKELAQQLLEASSITASNFEFKITVPAYDAVHVKIAEMVAAAWNDLGFKVSVDAVELKDNEDFAKTTNEKIPGVKDDVFAERIARGDFQVAAIDYVAYSADAFSVLAPFAKGYAGTATNAANSSAFVTKPHISGFDNSSYNEKIDAAAKEVSPSGRAALLHEAEDILLKDAGVIPVIFNKSVSMQSKELSKVEFNYYHNGLFTKANLKNYQEHLPQQ